MEATLVPSTCFVAHTVPGRRKLRRFPCTVALHLKSQFQSHDSCTWRSIRRLLKSYGESIARVSPEESLKQGHWVKLICGASFEDVADVRNLSLVYTLAGVDCIDCAAEESVVTAVNEGIAMAQQIFMSGDIDERLSLRRPWVMISVNDDKDLHFRKARANSYIRTSAAITELLQRDDVDSIEIHTSAGQLDSFRELCNNLSEAAKKLKLISVSLPDLGDSTIHAMKAMYSVMRPFLQSYNLWQLDGRPMSGDIGKGATKEAVAFSARMAADGNRPPGFLQLAGGTNSHTIDILKRKSLFQTTSISGVAYGGYARKVVGKILHKMFVLQDSHLASLYIEQFPCYLLEALEEAVALVGPIKSYGVHRS